MIFPKTLLPIPIFFFFYLDSVRAEPDCGKSKQSTCVDSDNLWVQPGNTMFQTIAPATIAAKHQLSTGLSLGYLKNPVLMETENSSFRIDQEWNLHFMGSVGISDRFEVTLDAPATLYQNGNIGDGTLTRSAIRDVRLGMGYGFIQRLKTGIPQGISLSSRFETAFPTGDKSSFASSRTLTFAPSLSMDYIKSSFLFAGMMGGRIRGENEIDGKVSSSQIYLAVAGSFELLSQKRLMVGAEMFALLGPWSSSLSSTEVLLTISSAPLWGSELSFSGSVGTTIPVFENDFFSPDLRTLFSVRYSPSDHDLDADRVLDRDDLCLNSLEDRDGFQDGDGCPDPDNDNDGILDGQDRCRDEAETMDGFEDDDGCPDLDDDKDNVSDEADTCRNVSEDRDGFQDEDGCPDPDNDNDGILDGKDTCSNGAEDFDGYKDDDGCPDPDNDFDQFPDETDNCPNAAEDRDGFQDEDGCPDPDNDKDGVLDGQDKCPTQPETLNGVDDGDGCPEPGAESLASWQNGKLVILSTIRFSAQKAVIDAKTQTLIQVIAMLVKGQAPLPQILLEAYPDRSKDSSVGALNLAEKRSSAIKASFVSLGIPADHITAAIGDLSADRKLNSSHVEITIER